jgi:DNA (cytosine-5)-methyltransferase 1
MIKAIDFFCGAGGLTRGLLDAGISVLAGIDSDQSLEKTYKLNNKPSQFLCRDIRKIDIRQLREELGISGHDHVLYAACTPCQPFSTLTRMQGRDRRKSLLHAFGELVRQAPPDFILVENVPGLNTAYGKRIYQNFLKTLRVCGFNHIYAELLDAQDFGVPQIRKRFILLASRVNEVMLPRRVRRRTVRDAISKFPALKAGQSNSKFLNHETRPLLPHHERLIKAVPKDGGSRQDITNKSLLLKCHRNKPKTHKDVFGRMAWDEPAPTLTGRCTDVYCGRFVHPSQNRGLSPREAAALQTFPDGYEFFGDYIFHLSKQIGNAVPVKLAKALGKAILTANNATLKP